MILHGSLADCPAVPKKPTNDLVRVVGRWIAELRLERMSQADFAEAMGTSVQWVSRVELGENLTLLTLEKVSKVLEVPIISLFVEPTKTVRAVKRGRPRKSKI